MRFKKISSNDLAYDENLEAVADVIESSISIRNLNIFIG